MKPSRRKSRRARLLPRKRAFQLIFSSALASLCTAAWSQEAAPPPADTPPADVQQTAQNTTQEAEMPSILVIGTTPLIGIGTAIELVPANVQTIRGREIDQQHPNTLTDYFATNLQSVDINDAQGNPSQMDISYRGFTASPLLGTPQGLSVFMDGVRINEPFGDVVNWDLIPQAAIDTIQLIPGSNPTFGLNTLGGAIAITTKNGSNSPGGEAEISGGSFGRKSAQIQ
jgi:outer membrane cobalamin receptor